MHAHNTNRNPPNNLKTGSAAVFDSVCGSLDPPGRSKKTSKTGWRYIQCADTPDELRVLIPPRPAAIYANLLKVEAHALAKNDADSLRDVQYIRHLKDAMVKRCQKLAQQTIHAASESQSSQPVSIVEAPLDFKLKRLEQWWEMMEVHGKTKGRSNHTKHQAHVERQSRMQSSPSTTTISPSKNRLHSVAVAQANEARGVVGQIQHLVNPQSSPVAHRKRPAPLTVPSAGHTISAQSSPLMPHAPQSPNRSSRHASTHLISSQSPQMQSSYDHSARPQLRHTTAYRPVYTNNQMTSPLETPHNPYFDPNQPLASTVASAQQYHPSPAGSRNGMLIEAHSPSVAVRNEMVPLANDPRTNKQHVYSSSDALSGPMTSQADPSHLKSRFHATYISSPSNSTSSPSSNASKPSAYAHQSLPYSRENGGAYSQTGSGQSSHMRTHTSFSVPLPNNVHPSISDRDHRRRATVDCDDTDRSVPRPKGYMYRSSVIYDKAHDGSPEMRYNEHNYDAQGARQTDGDYSPSALRHVTRVLNQSLVSAGSPLSSTGSQGSPRSRGSPGVRYAAEGSPHSQSSPGKGSHQARNYGATLSADQGYSYTNGGMNNGSPNLLPPAPALSRSRRGSNESDVNPGRVASSAQGDGVNTHPKQQLRRTVSRRSLRDRSPGGVEPAGVHPQSLVPEADHYASQGRSPRRATISPSDVQQSVESDSYHRGRTRRGERSPRRRYAYDTSPRHTDAVIPDMAILTPMTSKRNSRYTSGDSSVSEPVIPDVSLIMEAELSRNKADRVRRRLVPFQSSSEEGGARYESGSDDSDLSSSENEDEDHEDDYYRRPYRPRDGYGSGYASEAEGVKSRPLSRPPSRPPSRGILKRSSSMCSQRSSKSVRLEIPRDRRALEEVRDAEDKVDRAQKQLADLQRRKGSRSKNVDAEIQKATETLDQAERSLKEKHDEYQVILEAMKLRRSEQDEVEPRYV